MKKAMFAVLILLSVIFCAGCLQDPAETEQPDLITDFKKFCSDYITIKNEDGFDKAVFKNIPLSSLEDFIIRNNTFIETAEDSGYKNKITAGASFTLLSVYCEESINDEVVNIYSLNLHPETFEKLNNEELLYMHLVSSEFMFTKILENIVQTAENEYFNIYGSGVISLEEFKTAIEENASKLKDKFDDVVLYFDNPDFNSYRLNCVYYEEDILNLLQMSADTTDKAPKTIIISETMVD